MNLVGRKCLCFIFLIGYLSSGDPVLAGIYEVRSGVQDILKNTIAAAGRGDTILIHPGVYSEGLIEIGKPLLLKGIGKPVMDGGETNGLFLITSDSVIIDGLVIQNVGFSYTQDRAGIKMDNARFCRIINNEFHNTFFGIYLSKSEHCLVKGNYLKSVKRQEANSGNGIHLWDCREIQLLDNFISSHRDGIYLEFVENSLIQGNTSEDNLRYGLHFMFSNHDQYIGNLFRRNGTGVAVMFSSFILMERNEFRENWGGAAYGLLFKDINDSEVTANTFFRNTVGLVADGANRVVIRYNEFMENGWAVNMFGNSYNNSLRFNNFTGNSFDITTNADNQSNEYIHNFWDQYSGYDLDQNGWGDVPHRPVKLFSYVVEKVSASIVLLRSFFEEILNFAEKVSPVLTPVNLVDPEPSMNKNMYDHGKGA